MLPIVNTEDYLQAILTKQRMGLEDVLSFYEHRLGVICKDPRVMLIPLDDHLVHRGDGVFETLKFEHGKLVQLRAHLKRMERSCEQIYLQPPCSWQRVQEIVLEVCRAAGTREGIVSIYIGRGPGGFTVDLRECPEPSLYVVVRKLHPRPPEFWEQGVSAFKTSIPAKQDYLAVIKSVDYLPNVLMKREAVIKGYDFPLCFDEQGFLAEGATENACLIDQAGHLIVPEFKHALPGTTLLRALDLVQQEIMVIRRPVKEEELYEAKELLLLGTTIDCVGVVRYAGRPIHDVRPGPWAKRIRELLQKDVLETGVDI